MIEKCLKRIVFIVCVLACVHCLEANQDFFKDADTKVKISLIEIKQQSTCGLRVILGGSCHCTAIYQVDEILQAPEQLGVEAGDKMVLNYLCNKNKDTVGNGSRVSWAQTEEDGSLIMILPSHYLKPLGNRHWLLKNEEKIFGLAE